MMESEWFDSHRKLTNFAGVLVTINLLQTAENVVEFLEKPWKWNEEYALWLEHGCPYEDEGEWSAFYLAIDKLVGAA